MRNSVGKLAVLSVFWGMSALFSQDALVDSYKTIISNYPDRVNLVMKLGMILSERGDSTNAEKYLLMATKLDRQNADAYYNLGVARLKAGKYNEALDAFIKSTVFNTNDFASLVNLGNIYNLRNDSSTASFYYDRALEINPADPDLLCNMGILALKNRDFARAYDKLSQAFYFTQDEDIRYNFAVAAWYYGKKEKVRELYPVLSPSQRHFDALSRLLKD
jgi:tetratricopeptide (TPR) repeat protein